MKFLRILFIVIIPLVLIITLFNIPLQNKFGIFCKEYNIYNKRKRRVITQEWRHF